MGEEMSVGTMLKPATNCPVNIGTFRQHWCDREIHNAPDGIDQVPVCLMHTRDRRKAEGDLNAQFWAEIKRLLDEAGEGEASFAFFVFPSVKDHFKNQYVGCNFNHAIFGEYADFTTAYFAKPVSFANAFFAEGVNFLGTEFNGEASFFQAEFLEEANFHRSVFDGDGVLVGATFHRKADFTHTVFRQKAKFFRATFAEKADLSSIICEAPIELTDVKACSDINFANAVFSGRVSFEGMTIWGSCNFSEAQFLDSAMFRRVQFIPEIDGVPSFVFNFARLQKSGETVFDQTDLSRALFHNCDVSKVWFTSSVRWASQGNRRSVIFEELIPLTQEHAAGFLTEIGSRDYRAVAQLYQQLKKAYDDRLDYWTADEFHFGEMEMQRLVPTSFWRFRRIRQWWHTHMSLIALYRLGSDYGNNFVKPLWWLGSIVVAFGVAYPAPGIGIQHSSPSYQETYGSVLHQATSWSQAVRWEAGLVGKGLLTSADTASFQRSAEYSPAYPVGRSLAIAESLFVASLVGLFLLALRRRFRR